MPAVVEFEVSDAPPWLIQETPHSYRGTPHPGEYDFTIRAWTTENGVKSLESIRRIVGVVPYQVPVWITPEYIDATLDGVEVKVSLQATSLLANVGMTLAQASPPVELLDGVVQYTPNGEGDYSFEVTAYVVEDESVARSRTFRQSVVRSVLPEPEYLVERLVREVFESQYTPNESTQVMYCVYPDDIHRHFDEWAFVYVTNHTHGVARLVADGIEMMTHVVDGTGHHVTVSGEMYTLHDSSSSMMFIVRRDPRADTFSINRVGEDGAHPSVFIENVDFGEGMWSTVNFESESSGGPIGVVRLVTVGRDPRLDKILETPPLFDNVPAGIYRVGQDMSESALSGEDGVVYEALSTSIPGTYLDSGWLAGEPSEVGVYAVLLRKTAPSGLFTSRYIDAETILLDWENEEVVVMPRLGDSVETRAILRCSESDVHFKIEGDMGSISEAGVNIVWDGDSKTLSVTGDANELLPLEELSAVASVTVRGVTLYATLTLGIRIVSQLPEWVSDNALFAFEGIPRSYVLSASSDRDITYGVQDQPEGGFVEVASDGEMTVTMSSSGSFSVFASVSEFAIAVSTVSTRVVPRHDDLSMGGVVSQLQASLSRHGLLTSMAGASEVVYEPKMIFAAPVDFILSNRLDVYLIYVVSMGQGTGSLELAVGGSTLIEHSTGTTSHSVRFGDDEERIVPMTCAVKLRISWVSEDRAVVTSPSGVTGVSFDIVNGAFDVQCVTTSSVASIGDIYVTPVFDDRFRDVPWVFNLSPWLNIELLRHVAVTHAFSHPLNLPSTWDADVLMSDGVIGANVSDGSLKGMVAHYGVAWALLRAVHQGSGSYEDALLTVSTG